VRLAIDYGLGLLAFALVIGLRRLLAIPVPLNWPTVVACGTFFIMAAGGRALVQRRHRLPLRSSVLAGIFAVSAGLLFPVLFLVRSIGPGVSRLTLVLFEAASLVAVLSSNQWLRARGIEPTRTLVLVGDMQACAALARGVAMDPGVRIREILTDSGRFDVAAQLGSIERLIRTEHLEEIVLLSSLSSGQAHTDLYRGVVELSERSRITLHLCAPWLSSYDSVELDHLGGYPLLSFAYSPTAAWPLLFKRLQDVVIAAVGLVLAAPVLAFSALAIMAESGRPVVFSQIRPGLRGRPFRIYKLRTMITDAEAQLVGLKDRNEISSIAFKMTDDPRITRVGRWLRRTSIDEIPQLVNVLKGEMSMVGPRPIPCTLDRYDVDHLRRLAMKPGVTGLWQVSGRSQIADFSRWLELDTEYIRTWSLWKDLGILCRTVWTVLWLTGK